jgi:hypothetical protein
MVQNVDNVQWNSYGFATLPIMSALQSLLRHIPEPSIKLYLSLAAIGLVTLISLTWLGAIR